MNDVIIRMSLFYYDENFIKTLRLSISNTFEREASSAVLDFTNEDENNQNKKKRHW